MATVDVSAVTLRDRVMKQLAALRDARHQRVKPSCDELIARASDPGALFFWKKKRLLTEAGALDVLSSRAGDEDLQESFDRASALHRADEAKLTRLLAIAEVGDPVRIDDEEASLLLKVF